MKMTAKPHHNSIFLEQAEILEHQACEGQQYILRVHAPRCAATARPGTFVHLSCDPELPMRRPLSIMRVDADHGWVEFLYKVVGHGTALLAKREKGENLSLLGPVGQPFVADPARPKALLIGGGVGIPPMIFMADSLRRSPDPYQPLVIMGSEVPFPFTPQPSQILVPGIPDGTIASMPLLEDWGIASRLASLQGYPGCYEGYVTDVARAYLQDMEAADRQQVAIFSCGPYAMLGAVAALAREFDLPCQVSLEEHMACAVGGCAGCTVRVNTPEGTAMKRVCVDGPVFDATQVFS
jgi:dihydroorotate dehydrogenase electron transfer subunit